MHDPTEAGFEPDLGVPTARNARIYALAGLAITAIVGLLIWDVLGLSLGRTHAYPRDRRAAITAIAAGVVALALVIPIIISATNSGNEPIDCGNNQACLNEQRNGD